MVSQIDRQVGELLDLLDELAVAENTIVFFCSDHGAAERLDGELNSCGPFEGRKRSMYEGGLRTPMLVRWPGKIAAGRQSDLVWYFPDVLPTLLGKACKRQHPELYWECPKYDWKNRRYTNLMQAIRMGDMKLLRHQGGQPWELYNLAADPGENDNLEGIYPGIVTRRSLSGGGGYGMLMGL